MHNQGESLLLTRLATLYKCAVELGAVLLPMGLVAYLVAFHDPARIYRDDLAHEGASFVLIVLALLGGWMAFRSFRASGEPGLRYVTLALTGFALVHSIHAGLSYFYDQYTALFTLYGPAGRVVLTAFLLEALTRTGEAVESPERRADRGLWLVWLAAVAVLCLAVAGLSRLPGVNIANIHSAMEGLCAVLSLGGVVAIRWRGLSSGLAGSFQAALVAFGSSSLTFVLTNAWSHPWWMGHILFAGGFVLLNHGLARVWLTTRSLADMPSEEEMAVRLAAVETEAANLRDERDRLRQLLDSSPIGVLVSAPDGRILFCNRRHAEILGVEADRLLGQDAAAFVTDAALRRRIVAEVLASGHPIWGEVETVPVDGTRRRYMVSWSPLAFEGREAVVGWGLDLTPPPDEPPSR